MTIAVIRRSDVVRPVLGARCMFEGEIVEFCGSRILQHVLQFDESEADAAAVDPSTLENTANEWLDEPDMKYLKKLDPVKWKDYDHYRILGLKKLRWKATAAQIRMAYRLMSRKLHPDKNELSSEHVFGCLNKSYEYLTVPSQRRSYDSVDHTFNDEIPSEDEVKQKGFFTVLQSVFELNSRWSVSKKVPDLGNDSTPWEEVEDFYDFWYNFRSWRDFSYLDEEDASQGEDRYERRYIERQNRAKRKEMKVKETKRIFDLVELARRNDPRVLRRDAERQLEKERKKEEKLKQLELQRQKEEAARLEEERIKKEEEDRLAAVKLEEQRKRNVEKNALKRTRKTVRQMTVLGNERVKADLDLCERYEKMIQNCQINELEPFLAIKPEDVESYDKCLEVLISWEDAQAAKAQEERARAEKDRLANATSLAPEDDPNHSAHWRREELQILVKAMKLFPGGTTDRWQVVCAYCKQHCAGEGGFNKTQKLVIAKVKQLMDNDTALHKVAKDNAANDVMSAKKGPCVDAASESAPTEATVDDCKLAASQHAPNNINDAQSEKENMSNRPWTKDEQGRLEQALKKFNKPSAERWYQIAEAVGTRDKTAVIARCKYLAQLVKDKKAAKDAVADAKRK